LLKNGYIIQGYLFIGETSISVIYMIKPN